MSKDLVAGEFCPIISEGSSHSPRLLALTVDAESQE